MNEVSTNIIPIYYVIAIFIMLVALFSLRYEFTFLKNTKVGTFNWTISILNFLTVISLLVVLLVHHMMNQLVALRLILTLLLLLLCISAIQLITRRRLFRSMQLELHKERRKLIHDMQNIIDEKKREKIREKYQDEEANDSADPSSNGKSNL